MYIYIILTLIFLFIGLVCIKPSNMSTLVTASFCLISSAVVTIIINCVFFVVAYDSIDTKVVAHYENIKSNNYNYTVYKLALDTTLTVHRGVENLSTDLIESFAINKFMMTKAYPTKKTINLITLDNKNYELYCTFKANVKKRTDSLQKIK